MTQEFPPELVREFVIAAHGNLPRVKELLGQHPGLLNVANAWSENDHETAIQAAAHVGGVATAEFLLEQGAPLAIPTAAMLNRRPEVERLLAQDPGLIQAVGAHGIPLQAHAAFTGDAEFMAALYARGATQGLSMALSHAAMLGHAAVVRWLLGTGQVDLTWQNWQQKTALMLAQAGGHAEVAALLAAA